ncbi:hypothetical protein EON80_28870, partial [bacterium]
MQDDLSSVRFKRSTEHPKGYFEVWKKDGEILSFGLSEDSLTAPSALQEAYQWQLSKILDRRGNTIELKYGRPTEDSTPLLEEIEYGSNEIFQVSANRKIVFNYGMNP